MSFVSRIVSALGSEPVFRLPKTLNKRGQVCEIGKLDEYNSDPASKPAAGPWDGNFGRPISRSSATRSEFREKRCGRLSTY